jgi:sec-independent protein translocase protein TatB
MFDIGWSEMAVIMLVALVVIGPKDLPRLARSLGQWVAKGRAMAREFQRSLEDMAREAELDDVKREIEKVGRTNIRETIEKSIDPTGELGKAFDPTPNRSTPAAKVDGVKAAASPAVNGGAKPEPVAAANSEREAAAKSAPAVRSKPAAGAKPAAAAKSEPAAKSKPAARAKPAAAAKPEPAAKAETKPASPKAKETVSAEPH